MKTFVSLFSLLILPLFISSTVSGQDKSTTAGLRVIYFHGTNRCITCNNMEKYTRELLDEEYAKELKSGKIAFEVYNFDEASDSTITKKYAVESSTLIIVQMKGGKEKVTDLTDIGFSYAKYQPDKFKEEVQKKLNDKLR